MKTIVVGVDASDRNHHVLAEAIKLARAFNAKILAVRAVGIPVEVPFEAFQIRPDQFETTVIDAAKVALAATVKDIPAELALPAEVHLGAPWQVICDAATKTGADLVVIGTHSRNVIDRVLGTTAARVVNHAPCAVYVVR